MFASASHREGRGNLESVKGLGSRILYSYFNNDISIQSSRLFFLGSAKFCNSITHAKKQKRIELKKNKNKRDLSCSISEAAKRAHSCWHHKKDQRDVTNTTRSLHLNEMLRYGRNRWNKRGIRFFYLFSIHTFNSIRFMLLHFLKKSSTSAADSEKKREKNNNENISNEKVLFSW